MWALAEKALSALEESSIRDNLWAAQFHTAKGGNLPLLKLLVSKGSLAYVDGGDYTILPAAVLSGDIAIVKYLIEDCAAPGWLRLKIVPKENGFAKWRSPFELAVS